MRTMIKALLAVSFLSTAALAGTPAPKADKAAPAKTDAKADAKTDAKDAAKTDAKADAKTDAKDAAKTDSKTDAKAKATPKKPATK